MFFPALPVTTAANANRRFDRALAALERHARALVVVAVAVLAVASLGLASKHAFSVAFWPANGVLVGMMVRYPKLRCWSGWLGAACGFIAADCAFASAFHLAAFFAATNIIGSWTATMLLLRLDTRDLRLRRAHSILRILACLLPAALAAASVGALLVVVEFGGSPSQTALTWSASELVNYLIVLPAMLTTPRWRDRRGLGGGTAAPQYHKIWPVAALVVSCAAAVIFDGPGSIMFPMPALLLCALTYGTSTTAIVSMLLGTGCLTAIGMGAVDIGQDMAVPAMVVSIRIAVAFLVLVPLSVSCAMAAREDLLRQLRVTADHDGLTGLLNRRAFEQRMSERLAKSAIDGTSFAVLWLDIDHFKSINDRFGHLAGDRVLQAFATIARASCAADDLVGRVGGEEFALLVATTGAEAAAGVADRLRRAFAAHATAWNGTTIQATVSIGACHLSRSPGDLPQLLSRLDEALYRAKHQGRDRIVWLSEWPEMDAPEQRLLKIA